MYLHENFENVFHSYSFYENEQKTLFAETVRAKEQSDRDSILGTYCRLNPALRAPAMYHQMLFTESDRNILTKSRTGSHSLRILTGWNNNEDRTERLCLCKDNIQTIDHILFHCKVTKTFEISLIKKIMTYKSFLKIQIIHIHQAYYVVYLIGEKEVGGK